MYSGEIVIIKKKLFFKYVVDEDLQTALYNIKGNEKVTKQAPRFIVVTDNAGTPWRFGYIDLMELESEQMDEQGVYLKMGQNQIC